MPTYVYRFVDTDERIEIQQAFADDALTEAVHPSTGDVMAVKKVFLPVGVTFKGGGFYKNDSRPSSSKSDGKSDSKSDGKSDGTSTSSDSPSSSSPSESSSSSSGSSSSGSSPSGNGSSPSTSSKSSKPAAAGTSGSG